MYIGLDFDGTVVDHDFPRIGQPVPYAIEWLKKFIELDAKIILNTMRSNTGDYPNDHFTQAVNYLFDNGVDLYGINYNPTQGRWTTSNKVYAHCYIDDAAYGCPLNKFDDFNRQCVNWSIVGPDVERMIIRYNERNRIINK